VKKRKKKKDYSVTEKATAGILRFVVLFPVTSIILIIIWMIFA
jgi:hypothetical protein